MFICKHPSHFGVSPLWRQTGHWSSVFASTVACNYIVNARPVNSLSTVLDFKTSILMLAEFLFAFRGLQRCRDERLPIQDYAGLSL